MSKYYPALLLSALLLTTLARPVAAGPVEDGEEALAAGNHVVALRFFKIAIKANPDDERAWAGYEAATRAGRGAPAPARPAPARPAPAQATHTLPVAPRPVPVPRAAPTASAGVPLAGIQSQETAEIIDDDKQSSAAPTGGSTVDRYLRGEPIFYSESFKRLMRGKRVRDVRTAQKRYDAEKEEVTRYYTRKYQGNLGISATLFTPRLYSFLACLRAAKGKLGEKGAHEIFVKEGDRAFKLLEFYMVLKNLTYQGGISARQKKIDITGIEGKVFLEDDRGTRYLPYKAKAPATEKLKHLDNFTVWFAPISKDGTPIWENAVSELRLVIEGVRGEAKRIIFPFSKGTFRRMVEVSG